MPAAVGALLLLLAGCSASSGGPPKPAVPGADAPTGASVGTEPTVETEIRLDCRAPIDETDEPDPSVVTHLGVVGWSGEGAEPWRDEASPAGYLAKTGLQVRSGARFRIESADPGVAMWWGNGSGVAFGRAVVVDGCEWVEGKAWLAYPGYLAVPEPMCVRLDVTARGRTETAAIPVGAAC